MWGVGCGGGRPGRDGADACASDEGHRGWEVCSGAAVGGAGGHAGAEGAGQRPTRARFARGAPRGRSRASRAREPGPVGDGARGGDAPPARRGREPAGAFSIISLRPPRDRRARGEARTFGASGTCGVTSAGVALLVLGASGRARKCRAGARERALRDVGGKISRSALERRIAGSGRHSRGSRSRIASYSAPGHGGRGNAATALSKPRTAGSFPVKNRATNPPSAFHRSKSSAFRVPTHSPVRADRDGSWPRDSGARADKRRNRRVANRAKHASDKASVPGSIFTQDPRRIARVRNPRVNKPGRRDLALKT